MQKKTPLKKTLAKRKPPRKNNNNNLSIQAKQGTEVYPVFYYLKVPTDFTIIIPNLPTRNIEL